MNFYETLEYGSTYLLPCYRIRRSLEFDMQHDHIRKKLNLCLSSTPYVHPEDLICFISFVPLPAKWLDRFGKNIDNGLSY